MKTREKSKARFQTVKWQADFLKLHPTIFGGFLIIIYFMMDAMMLNTSTKIADAVTAACLLLTLAIFYISYVRTYQTDSASRSVDIPKFIQNPKKYTTRMFPLLTILIVAVPFLYEGFFLRWMPNLGEVYYPSQVFLLVLVAPVMEELAFRYFLYDKWARSTYGPLKGILLTGFLFVICHPVSDINGIILYWVPTLLFYLIYENFGLYGAIAAHMIFNFIAI